MSSSKENCTFDQLISSIRKKLPIQNPLHGFVHNNILQTFEGKDFHEAITEAGSLYRARPYWPLAKYKQKFFEGKITDGDIFRGIEHYLGLYAPIPSLDKLELTAKEYFYRLMFAELAFNDEGIQPQIENHHLWSICQEKMDQQSLTLKRSRVSWRGKDYWEKYHKESFALSVHPLIIRLISSYLDQGQSFWSNPYLQDGFFHFFVSDITSMKGFTTGWRSHLYELTQEFKERDPKDVIETILMRKGIPEEAWEPYLLEILFDLKGWSGMVNKLETEPWQAIVKAPPVKLTDYLASLVLMEAAIDQYHSKVHSIDLSSIHGRTETPLLKSFQLSLALYQITLSFKLPERWMLRIETQDLLKLISEIDESEYRDQIRLWHEVYENHYHRHALEALAGHAKKSTQENPSYAQVLFCIDDREESMRRHLEEVDPLVKTYGVVGFFGIDMKFSSFKNDRLIAQCPPVVNPSRVVKEKLKEQDPVFKRWNILRGGSDLYLYYNSRTLFRGYLSSLLLGLMSVVPMFLQVFFPVESRKLLKKFFTSLVPLPQSEIALDKGPADYGYTKAEMASIVSTILDMCGIKNEFSDFVAIVGHGSSSSNNPFKKAYGCGACGGNAGIPNAKAFAQMANDPLVRSELKKLGHNIPDRTFFLSAYHDTCTDEITFYNDHQLPQDLRSNFERLKGNLARASELNAFERCQRFSSFPKDATPERAFLHVKRRASDIAQPRPEYGHSSNALAIVGQRSLTRGLYLNRRAFLLSYDWRRDTDGEILRQVVVGGVPVSVNINLDYYFSAVDNDSFGCGSKLPLNMTSLLGVMTGSQGDLRIGLARQMVEIHEPVRNLTIIEAPLDRVRTLFDSHPRLKNILYHHWMKLAVKDPLTERWWIFGNDSFIPLEIHDGELPKFNSTLELLAKTQTSLDFAEILK